MGNLRAKNEGEARELIPAGNYFGTIVGVYDLGTQTGGQFGAKHQLLVQFELHRKKGPCRNKNGDILTISNFYNLSFNEKANLRLDVEAITGCQFSEEEAKEGYDVEELLGKCCRLTVAHEAKAQGGMRDVISNVMQLDEDDDEPRGEMSQVYYEIDGTGEFPADVPEWVQKIVRKAPEFAPRRQQGAGRRNAPPSREPAAAPAAPARNGAGRRNAAPAVSDDEDLPF